MRGGAVGVVGLGQQAGHVLLGRARGDVQAAISLLPSRVTRLPRSTAGTAPSAQGAAPPTQHDHAGRERLANRLRGQPGLADIGTRQRRSLLRHVTDVWVLLAVQTAWSWTRVEVLGAALVTPLDMRWVPPRGRAPTPIRTGQLSGPQLTGTACVCCAATITANDRHEVGFIGRSTRPLFGCTGCVVTLRRRLPIWPVPGSA
jgi:hypothetical protein